MAKQFGNLTYADYSPQYVGQDIEGVKALAKKSDEDYNNNLASMDKMDILENEMYQRVDPKDAEYVKNAIEKSKNNLASIKNSGRYEDAQYLLNKSAKELAMDNNLTGAMQWKQNKDATIKEIQDRVGKSDKENGITQQQADDSIRMIQNNPDNKKKVVWNPETLTFDNKFVGYTPKKYVDIGSMANDFLKDWKPDTKVIDGKSVNGYYNNISHEWASQDDMNKSAKEYINANAEAKSYMDEQDMFHKEKNFRNSDGSYRSVNNNDLANLGLTNSKFEKETGVSLDTLTPQQKEGAYFNLLRNHTLLNYTNPSADKYSYDKDTEHNVKDWIQEVYMKDALRKKASEEELGKSETFDTNKEDNKNLTQGTPLEGIDLTSDFDTSGNLIPKTTGRVRKMTDKEEQDIYKKYGTTRDGVGKAAELAQAEIDAGVQQPDVFDWNTNHKNMASILKLQKENPELQGLKPKQVMEAYIEARKNSTQQSQVAKSLNGLDTKKITNDVINNLNGREIVVDGKSDGTLTGALSTLNLSSKDDITEMLKDAKSNSILPVGGKFLFQIKDKDGVDHEVTISGSKEQQAYYDAPTKMAELENKGETGEGTFMAQDPDKISKNKGNINDNTKSEYGYKTQIVTDVSGKKVMKTTGGKFVTKDAKETKAYLDYKLKQLGEQNGKDFINNLTIVNGRVTTSNNPNEIMDESHSNWKNSEYNMSNRVKETKNPIEESTDDNSNE